MIQQFRILFGRSFQAGLSALSLLSQRMPLLSLTLVSHKLKDRFLKIAARSGLGTSCNTDFVLDLP